MVADENLKEAEDIPIEYKLNQIGVNSLYEGDISKEGKAGKSDRTCL
mgnify:CR=1 FL=1